MKNMLYSVDNFKLEGTQVPLPGTVVLLGSGLAGLVFWRRRWTASKS
jgi:hypothetical protein